MPRVHVCVYSASVYLPSSLIIDNDKAVDVRDWMQKNTLNPAPPQVILTRTLSSMFGASGSETAMANPLE